MTPTYSGALDGVRVLDLSRFIAGPTCAQILGDMGAQVIKIERPNGEDSRHHEPFYQGESVYTMLYNRNKYGATLDTRQERALGILESLIRQSDIVVENYRPGTIDKMGIGFERMKEIKPDIILVSISGFGQTGPDSRRGLFDAIAQAASGLMSITGDPDGSPVLTGTYIADYITGFHGAIGALTALLHKERTGEGQLVDVASLDAVFSTLGTRLIAYLMLGLDMPRSGSRDLLTAPVNVYECKDGSIYIQAGTNSLFPRLCRAIRREDLLEREEFRRVTGRMRNKEPLEAAVREWSSTRTAAEISQVLDDAGIPNSKVATIADVVESPQIAAREMIVEVDHPTLGTMRIPGLPVKMSVSPASIRKPPPTVGEDNDFVYGKLLGMTEAEIYQLRNDGVI
jgi:crotonobetainyl-CoA:carnitine CoA-transferase CaiB-like acyl-CoA transferase